MRADEMPFALFRAYTQVVGPDGEFVRLGVPITPHPDTINGVKLTPTENHDFIQWINHVRPDVAAITVGDPDVEGHAGVIVESVDLSGMNMREAFQAVIETEAYWNAPDLPEEEGSKAHILRSVTALYRRGVNKDPVTRLGGGERAMFEDPRHLGLVTRLRIRQRRLNQHRKIDQGRVR
jgi:hypothetical protein